MEKPSVQWQRNNNLMLSTLNQAYPASMTTETVYRVVAERGARTKSLELRCAAPGDGRYV